MHITVCIKCSKDIASWYKYMYICAYPEEGHVEHFRGRGTTERVGMNTVIHYLL